MRPPYEPRAYIFLGRELAVGNIKSSTMIDEIMEQQSGATVEHTTLDAAEATEIGRCVVKWKLRPEERTLPEPGKRPHNSEDDCLAIVELVEIIGKAKWSYVVTRLHQMHRCTHLADDQSGGQKINKKYTDLREKYKNTYEIPPFKPTARQKISNVEESCSSSL
ncbi:hypothetical protein PROFUN_12898 [Planoprotostelium fungivorum]|uniref:Myb-like domain-containing protein n=1 Tax=Planoprotostelium fungivorum TaxID=1890364 RepID=A0A2P6MWN4_9EUKA|nr:hypothetical protein PROFUN_12898 [Planoprotostelium fungivorum]